MSSISIRDYEERLGQLAAAPVTPQAMQQAIDLARGLLSTLRNWGTPPVQPLTLKQRAQSLKPTERDPHAGLVDHSDQAATPIAQPVQRIAAAKAPKPQGFQPRRSTVTTPAPPIDKRTPPAPEGFMSAREVLALLERPVTWINVAVYNGHFPKAEHKIGQYNYWRRTTVEAWRAKHPTPPAKRVDPALYAPLVAQPEGTLTLAQVCLLVGRSDPWIYARMRETGDRIRPFPRSCQKWHGKALWLESAVRDWLAWRVSAEVTILRKPLGQSSTT